MYPMVDNRGSYNNGIITPHLTASSGLYSNDRLVHNSLDSQKQSSFLNNGRFPDYLRRLLDFRQMDFEATFDQMITLLSSEPQKV